LSDPPSGDGTSCSKRIQTYRGCVFIERYVAIFNGVGSSAMCSNHHLKTGGFGAISSFAVSLNLNKLVFTFCLVQFVLCQLHLLLQLLDLIIQPFLCLYCIIPSVTFYACLAHFTGRTDIVARIFHSVIFLFSLTQACSQPACMHECE